jgi:hypothetical protein
VLLAASLLPAMLPPLRWMWSTRYGIPVKDHISQGWAFLICLFVSLHLALAAFTAGNRLPALGFLLLAALFAVDILSVIASRTAIASLPVLLVVFALYHFRWRGAVAVLLLGAIAGGLAWMTSSYLRQRVEAVVVHVQQYGSDNRRTSAGERLEFWNKSLRMIADAPVIGHGTGSIKDRFRDVAAGPGGLSALVTANPHNQTLAVGIQLGLIGVAVMWAMWIAHLLLFRGDGVIAWFGLVVVVASVTGSLFNSLLFDFTQGWTYVVLVGVAAATMLRQRQPAPRAVSAP